MRFLSLLSIGVFVAFGTACQRHPLPGDPHPALHEGHDEHKSSGETHSASPASGETQGLKGPEPVRPAEGAKSEEAPKFFPEKK